MGLFGNSKMKDGMKEFEDMRQALKPAERPHDRAEGGKSDGGAAGQDVQQTPKITSNITLAPATRPMSKTEPTPSEKCTSVVSAGSIWQGNLTIEGSVRIDGRLSGEVDAQGTVHVSEGAQVDAKVCAAFVIIAGTFQGQVRCSERLEILPTGRAQAELTTKSLVVHEGAFVEGQVHMIEDKTIEDKPAGDKMAEGKPAVAPSQAPHHNGANGSPARAAETKAAAGTPSPATSA